MEQLKFTCRRKIPGIGSSSVLFLTKAVNFLNWVKREMHYYYNVLTRLIIEMASVDRNRGYLTSSFTILSNTSSSSSPGKGDYKASNKILLTGLNITYN